MSSILMVEDDKEITELLEQYLPKYNLELFSVTRPSVALDKLKIEQYDLVLLDLGLPEMDGLELCKIIKENYPNLPVVISTARGDVVDKVIGLDVGADDYVAKPYDPRELVARIQNIIRRYQKHDAASSTEDLSLNEQSMQILLKGTPLDLTMAEYEILSLLIKKRQQIVSREFIINSANSINWDSSDRSIDVIVGRIRSKLGDNPKQPTYIKSIRGVGYKLIK
jgi:two-component system OmpR family response regulator